MIPVLITQSVLQIASRKNSNDKKNLNKFLNKTYSLGLSFFIIYWFNYNNFFKMDYFLYVWCI